MTEKPITFDDWRKVIIDEHSTTIESGYANLDAAAAWFGRFDIQLEVGSKATEFEPYNGGTFNPGDTIPALPGVNTIFADAGKITVAGKADIGVAGMTITEDRLKNIDFTDPYTTATQVIIVRK
jgi:hypothetical protein